jgi:hypothetical protein
MGGQVGYTSAHAASAGRLTLLLAALTPAGNGRMAEGTIKRLTDKGFGFIDQGTGKDIFFHMSMSCVRVRE